MPTATQPPDPAADTTLFARIPHPLDEPSRIARYDQPLATRLIQLGIAHSLRGFSLPVTMSHPAGVAIEVRVPTLADCGFVIECLANLGAPPETLIELETDNASMETSLSEFMPE